MKKVDYKITIGSTCFNTKKNTDILEIDVSSLFYVPANSAKIVLNPDAKIYAKPGDKVKIEIGYDDSLSKVFTGKAVNIMPGIHYTKIEAASSFSSLACSYINVLFEQQTAGKIAEKLFGKFNIDKADIQAGEKFPVYMLSDYVSVWEHIQDLAVYCGFDFYANYEDKAVFALYKGKKTHTFSYGKDILDFCYTKMDPAPDGVEIYGQSPAGQGQGDEAVSWLTKKEVKGTQGKSSGKILRIAEPIVRNKDLAKTLAKNVMRSSSVSSKSRLCVIGAEKVRLGSKVKIKNLESDTLNQNILDLGFKVIGVRHRLNKKIGFVTELSLIEPQK